MPCMCGDLYCWSCGPAQGNNRCHACGKWDLDGGCDDPEFCESILREQEAEEYKTYLIETLTEITAKQQGLEVYEVNIPNEIIEEWEKMPVNALKAKVEKFQKPSTM